MNTNPFRPASETLEKVNRLIASHAVQCEQFVRDGISKAIHDGVKHRRYAVEYSLPEGSDFGSYIPGSMARAISKQLVDAGYRTSLKWPDYRGHGDEYRAICISWAPKGMDPFVNPHDPEDSDDDGEPINPPPAPEPTLVQTLRGWITRLFS